MLLIVSYWPIIQMTYYKLYKYLTTLVISRTKSIQIATTPHPHWLSLSHRLNTTKAEVAGLFHSPAALSEFKLRKYISRPPKWTNQPLISCSRLKPTWAISQGIHFLADLEKMSQSWAEVGSYLPSCQREVSKEYVLVSDRYPANLWRGIQPCPRTFALPGKWLFCQDFWRRVHNGFVFNCNPARHQCLTAPIDSQFLKMLITLVNPEARGDRTLTSPLLLRTSVPWKQCQRLTRLT